MTALGLSSMTDDEKRLARAISILLAKVETHPAWVAAAAYDKFNWDKVLTERVRVTNVLSWMERKERYPNTE